MKNDFSEQADGLADKVSSDPANARNKRQATTVYGKWANNTVYFYYDSSVSTWPPFISFN